jgi:hypothetical protein
VVRSYRCHAPTIRSLYRLAERRQHSGGRVDILQESGRRGAFGEPQITREQEEILDLPQRGFGDVEEADVVSAKEALRSFRDVRWNGDRRTPQLLRDSKAFVRRKIRRKRVHREDDTVASLPNLDVPKFLHGLAIGTALEKLRVIDWSAELRTANPTPNP